MEACPLTSFLSFFKTLVDHEVTVELKNDISIKGVLKSVDQFLNIKLDDIQVVDELKYPHLVSPAALPLWSTQQLSKGNLGALEVKTEVLIICFYI